MTPQRASIIKQFSQARFAGQFINSVSELPILRHKPLYSDLAGRNSLTTAAQRLPRPSTNFDEQKPVSSQHENGAVECTVSSSKEPATSNAPSTSNRNYYHELLGAAIGVALLLLPSAAQAAEAAPEGFFELILTTVENLGPWGPAAFTLAVAICECIPLFPTQPFSIASGLLFGAQKGALCMLTGTTFAAVLAFLVARGVGRPLAERIIRAEMAESSNESTPSTNTAGIEKKPGAVQSKLMEVQETIERGSFAQQASAVFILRLTPIVPFSASNYVLGLSPLPLPSYLAGSLPAMAFWAVGYASLGGASRALLRRGDDPDALLASLLAKAGNYTEEAGIVALVAAGVGMLVYTAVSLRQKMKGESGGELADPSTTRE